MLGQFLLINLGLIHLSSLPGELPRLAVVVSHPLDRAMMALALPFNFGLGRPFTATNSGCQDSNLMRFIVSELRLLLG